MINKITLNSTYSSFVIHLDDEKPYFKLVKFRFMPDDAVKHSENYQGIGLKYIKRVKPGSRSEIGDIENGEPLLSSRIDPEQKSSETNLDSIINPADDFNYSKVEFILENANPEIDLELWYETEELIPFEEASKGFKQHLEQKGNTKILFSGAFGTGKTTFLKEYFNGNTCYEVFHLFPVNYSVASNEDIFRYIKAELLFLLLEKGVEFDQERFKKTATAPAFLNEHALEILMPFTRLIPQIGKNLHDVLLELIDLKSKFETYHEELQSDDKKKAKKFIEEIYEKEGSVFEDNFYTQLIRQLLEKINEEGKQTVLIIDDLDRIDPEHIFRLLNVFAAQFDQRDWHGSPANKFGFDRVILVCHYENLKKIFQHKYGVDTDYSGYVDKYFSKARFEFDSRSIIRTLVKDAFKNKQHETLRIFELMLIALTNDDRLTLREAIKLIDSDLKQLTYEVMPSTFLCLKQLCFVTDIDSIIERFQHCKQSLSEPEDGFNKNEYDFYFKLALVDLLFPSGDFFIETTSKYKLIEKKQEITLTVSSFRRQRQIKSFVVEQDGKPTETVFNRSDFFSILEEIAKLYKQVNARRGFFDK